MNTVPEHNLQINNIQNQGNIGRNLSKNDREILRDAIREIVDEERNESNRSLERFVFVVALLICVNFHFFNHFENTIPQLTFVALEFILLLAYSLKLGLKTIAFALIKMIPFINKIGE